MTTSPLVVAGQHWLVPSTRPTFALVTNLVDDSNSITVYGNAPAIRRGHNAQLDSYQEYLAGQSENKFLTTTRYLNGFVLFENCPPAKATRMDKKNYFPQLNTPLYDAAFNTLTRVERHAARYTQQHPEYDVLAVTFIMTDGNNNASEREAADVRPVVERMFESGQHIIRGIGVRDDEGTNFMQVFQSMGIPENFIQVWERKDDDIARGMKDMSKQTVHSTMSGEAFRRATRTGFTNTGGSGGSDT